MLRQTALVPSSSLAGQLRGTLIGAELMPVPGRYSRANTPGLAAAVGVQGSSWPPLPAGLHTPLVGAQTPPVWPWLATTTQVKLFGHRPGTTHWSDRRRGCRTAGEVAVGDVMHKPEAHLVPAVH